MLIFKKREFMDKKSLFYISLFLLCLFLACLAVNYDYDLFARIIVGENIIENFILPYRDFLSYTPTHNWYDHEWGSGVIFYLLIKYFGPIGLIILQSLATFIITVFVIKTQKLQNKAFPVSIIFAAIFAILFQYLNANLVRCQLFSFMFFSIFLYILEKYRKCGTTKLIWFFPIITLVWNNLHGGVTAGLGLVFMYISGMVIERKNVKKLFISFLLSLFLLLLNPYGIAYLAFLFSAVTMERKYVVEWWPFFYQHHIKYYIFPTLLLIIGYFAKLINYKKLDITRFLVLSVTLYMGLAHVKLMTLSLIVISALCYNEISKFFLKFKKQLKKLEKSIYLAIVILSVTIPMFSPNVARANFLKLPLTEVEFLNVNNINGNIVVPFGFGSYVSYKRYPKNLIYMDGRYEEVYNNREFLTLKDYELGLNNWQDIINNYDTEVLMPLKNIAVYKVIEDSQDWVKIYEGPLCGIFINKNSPYIKKQYLEPTKNIMYYRENMFKHEGDFSQ